jgi:hypothetical protein
LTVLSGPKFFIAGPGALTPDQWSGHANVSFCLAVLGNPGRIAKFSNERLIG